MNNAEATKITLPYPPSLNNLYSTNRQGRRFLTQRGKDFKQEVRIIAFSAGRRTKIDGDVKLTVDVYRPIRTGDLDNTLKVLQDSLEGILYHNDRQVVEIHARRFDDKNNPRAEVVIESAGDGRLWD